MENVAEAYDSLLFKIDDIQKKLNEVIEVLNEHSATLNAKQPSYNNRYIYSSIKEEIQPLSESKNPSVGPVT